MIGVQSKCALVNIMNIIFILAVSLIPHIIIYFLFVSVKKEGEEIEDEGSFAKLIRWLYGFFTISWYSRIVLQAFIFIIMSSMREAYVMDLSTNRKNFSVLI